MTMSTFWSDDWTAAVVNHLWQSTVVVVIAWLLTLPLRRHHARSRYWVWMGASIKFLLPFSLLIEAGEWLRSLVPATEAPISMQATTLMEQIQRPFSQTQFSTELQMPLATGNTNLLPVLILSIWACGTLIVTARFAYAWWRILAVKVAATRLEFVAELPVLSSPASIEPGIFGIFHPVLLLPDGIEQRLNTEQLQTIVVHETCHLHRKDNLTYAIHMVVEALFWFHPGVWWIGMRLIDERERACDEAVVQAGGAAQVYAEGILKVCEYYVAPSSDCISGVSGGNLKKRILRIMSAHLALRLTWRVKSLLAMTILIILALPLALGLAQAATQNARSSARHVTLALSGAFPEISLYGPVTTHPKAGDVAPGIVFKNILSAPGGADWKQSNLKGWLTILVFSLRTSKNPQIVTPWNKLIDEFAGKPVQFLMISGEQESTLLPWLGQNPIKGWVFDDPDGKTGNAYGLQEPATVFVGTDGKIIGFGFGGFPPQNSEVNAALEGRITTNQPTPATMKTFLENHQVLLYAEPFKFPRADAYKPNFPPSNELHVSPSQGSAAEGKGNFGGPDYRVLRNYTLKEAISDVYDVNPIRVSLPASLDNNKRFDFSILLPQPESDKERIKARMKQGLDDYFRIMGGRENRVADVYVLSVVAGHKAPSIRRSGDEEIGSMDGSSSGGVGFEAQDDSIDDPQTAMKPVNLSIVRSVSFSGPADQFCQMLEGELDRPVVDETHWQGKIENQLDTAVKSSTNDFLPRLRDQYGLIITPAQRKIETLVFASR
jgi:uncharacterized protein (TIGR03435 family)